jgi:hypothetical protein
MIAFLEKYLILEKFEQEIRNAIKNRQKVSLLYAGVKGKQVDPKTGKLKGRDSDTTVSTPPGRRIGLPVAIGTDIRNQQTSVRFYQTSGSQTSGRHEGGVETSPWKEFRTDRITGIIPWEGNDAIVENPEGLPEWNKFSEADKYMPDNYNIYTDNPSDQGDQPITSVPVKTEPSTIKPMPKLSKLAKIPDDTKIVLKPEKPAPAAKSVGKPSPAAQPKPKPTVQPVTPPQGKTELPPVVPPMEPTEPEAKQPKPLNEWYKWLNKILNN